MHDGKVYLPTSGFGALGMHVVDATTGDLQRILAAGETTQSLAIDRAGNVYFFGRDAFLAYDAAGTLRWDAWAHNSTRNSVVIGADGFILATNGTGPTAYRPVTLPGDMNCDGFFNGGDIDPFFLALGDPPAWQAAHPGCDLLCVTDVNHDGQLNGGDIDPFFLALGRGACP